MVYHIAYLVTWWPSWLRESPRYLIPSNECSMISFAFPTRLLCMRSSFWVLSRILGPIPSISAILEKNTHQWNKPSYIFFPYYNIRIVVFLISGQLTSTKLQNLFAITVKADALWAGVFIRFHTSLIRIKHFKLSVWNLKDTPHRRCN